MAVRLYADDFLVYDSRLDDRRVLALKTTTGLNKSGTLTVMLPPKHPAYHRFISYKTVVALYEDNALRFRGRPLYPADDFYNRRTITCEGERGFFRDIIARPYLYQDSPANIFAQALELYNSEADTFKRFTLGEVTVTDANDYVRFESDSATTFAEFFNKLVERCGGYITFNNNSKGGRAVNWLAEIGTQSNQPIEFGENLLEFARSGQSDGLATAVLPYGAKSEEDGTRLTISGVNPDGSDWIQDSAAVAARGLIIATHTWDDVTDPYNLLKKAEKWLDTHKLAITSLRVTAADLSRQNRSIDSYHDGDRVQVISKPHGLDDWFQLTDREVDWLNPAGGNISLGKSTTSLTGADVAGDRDSANELDRVKHEVLADYQTGIANAVQEATLTLSSLIQQTSESIMLEVSEKYMTGDDVTGLVESKITQLADSISFTFKTLQTQVEEIDGETRTKFTEIEKYIRFENGDILLGESGNAITLRIENDIIKFMDGGAVVAYISNKKIFITDAHFLNSLRIGRFEYRPRANGHLSLVVVEEGT